METLDYSFVEQHKKGVVEKDEAIRLFKFLKGVYEGKQVQECIYGNWVDIKLGYDVLCVFDNFRIKPGEDKQQETQKDMEQKTEIERIMEERQKIEQKAEFKAVGTGETFAPHVTNVQSDEEIYGSLLDKLFTTYKAKDADYGSAFAEMFEELGIDYAYGKLREKMNRIKVLRKQPNMVENEGLEDALLDTAGYAILTLVELKKRKDNGI